jgi:hypothetical protein
LADSVPEAAAARAQSKNHRRRVADGFRAPKLPNECADCRISHEISSMIETVIRALKKPVLATLPEWHFEKINFG